MNRFAVEGPAGGGGSVLGQGIIGESHIKAGGRFLYSMSYYGLRLDGFL